jgi:hypothetical protein
LKAVWWIGGLGVAIITLVLGIALASGNQFPAAMVQASETPARSAASTDAASATPIPPTQAFTQTFAAPSPTALLTPTPIPVTPTQPPASTSAPTRAATSAASTTGCANVAGTWNGQFLPGNGKDSNGVTFNLVQDGCKVQGTAYYFGPLQPINANQSYASLQTQTLKGTVSESSLQLENFSFYYFRGSTDSERCTAEFPMTLSIKDSKMYAIASPSCKMSFQTMNFTIEFFLGK